MLRRTLLALAVMSAALAPVASQATPVTRSIDVVNDAYVARAVVAVAGDTIRWNVKGSGSCDTGGGCPGGGGGHTVTAYSGGSFDSGIVTLKANERFEAAYGGGTILYRCRNHSLLSGPANDCAGMCGKLTDLPPSDLPTAPTVNSPVHNSTTDSRLVTFTGGVTGSAILVRMFEGATEYGHGVQISQASWQFTWSLENGTHDLYFVAEHPEGFLSAAGPARTVPNPDPDGSPTIVERFIRVTVASSDSAPPLILLDQPRDAANGVGGTPQERPQATRSPVIVNGRVLDDVAVGTCASASTCAIAVFVRDNVLMLNKPPRPVTCVGCGTNSASFYAPYALDPGYYTITVTAKDLTNKVSVANRDVVVLA